ncbi:MAG: hypothetical protein COB50_03175 [Thiotrichales bacterium]|nr:MAG: hypothetical protein COB50_03175 [Thiotrichales bacterium]
MRKILLVLSFVALPLAIHAMPIRGYVNDCKTKYTTLHYTINTNKHVTLDKAKVTINAYASVKPEELASTLSRIESLKLAKGESLKLVNFTEKKTKTGMLYVSATLSITMPLSNVNAVYAFAKKQSKEGINFKVSSITPYLDHETMSSIKEKLAVDMYKKATNLADKFSSVGGLHYRIQNFRFYAYPVNDRYRRMPRTIMLAEGKVSNVHGVTKNSSKPIVNLQVDKVIKANADIDFIAKFPDDQSFTATPKKLMSDSYNDISDANVKLRN